MKSLKNNILIFIAIVSFAKAQQNSLFNTYSYDLMQLNIASIGRTCLEANMNYRSQWVGLKEAPTLYQVNAALALGKSNGVGIKVYQQTYGLLKLVNFTGGYAYRAQLTKTAKLHLGIGTSYNQNSFDASKANVLENNDQSLANKNLQRTNNFDCEAGAMFFNEKLTAGVSAYHIYNTNNSFQAVSLKLKPQFNFMGGYKINVGNNLQIEPWLVERYTVTGTNNFETMINFKFFQAITLAGGYRVNYGVLAMAGFELGKIRIAYSFDYANGKNVGSTHQVLLGIDLCKKKKQQLPDSTVSEVPRATEIPATPSIAPVEEKKVEVPAMVEGPKVEEPKKIEEPKTETIAAIAEPIKVETPKIEPIIVPENSIEGVLSSENANVHWRNKTVKLLNEKGEVVEETKTNNYGAFVFKHLKGDQNYMVSIDDSDPSIKSGSKISMKSITGKEIKTWTKGNEKTNFKIISSDKNFLTDLKAEDESLEMAVSGVIFDQNGKPVKYAHLIAKEIDGSNPQKIISDINGRFNFKTLNAEKNYIFETEENDKTLEGITQIKIGNAKGKIFKTIDLNAGKFSFQLLDADKNELSQYKVEDLFVESLLRTTKKSEPVKVEPAIVEKKKEEVVTNAKATIPQETNPIAEQIIFEKNSIKISLENREKLKEIAKIINAKTGHVTIVGYASNDGKPGHNIYLAQARSHIVRMVLLSYGVKASRLSEKNGGATEVVNQNHDGNRTVRFEE